MGNENAIYRVPTNIITGFLGTGKTSAILHLLKNKPSSEKWAVLVNEFGEIGVDGSLFEGQHSQEQGVFIREVPGGCMCCTAGLPMQVALNVLLTKARPDRLLIEPTGLGHPVEVLGVLSGEHYQESLSIHKIITLVDARNLSDPRYTDHQTFNQQIAIADLIVGNKADLYQDEDHSKLEHYAEQHGASHAELLITEQGVLEPAWLEGQTQAAEAAHHHHHHHTDRQPSISDLPIPESGYLKAENQGEGFCSVGWRFTPYRVFDRSKLFSFFSGLDAERMKGVFITSKGIFGYNLTADGLTEIPMDECAESRIEIIAPEIESGWEKQLMECITPD
ncbi:CobW family GTP-binding protein [Pontiella agarivorans]|uniref:GTP-binding protein n=1 Tax=Pontiella agarivorans TaxID=3038953 RepID=A0ABU5MVG3_9BACT|nr:GTP-binding protein [Pontiella agarivorans]MDZ8117941.1 GTP-binding protein [Pontiella agarivorans]